MPSSSDALAIPNLWTTIIITLFVLSLINERLSNFLKLYLQVWFPDQRRDPKLYKRATRWRRYIGNWLKLKNLYRPELRSKEKEKEREGGLVFLTICCGIFTAFVTGADLFLIIDGQSGQLETSKLIDYSNLWNQSSGFKGVGGRLLHGLFRHGVGFICTGFLVSLGSKFWHDVLDLVLYSSNLKRKLADPQTFQGATADEVTEYINLGPNELAKRAISEFGPRLKQQYPNIVQINAGRRRMGNQVKDVVSIYLTDQHTQGIPLILPVGLPSGRVVSIDTVVIPNCTSPVKALSGSGDAISKIDSALFGTVCCLLCKPAEPQKRYALTCNHVLTDRNFNNPDGWINNPSVGVQLNGQPIGTWVFGKLDSFADVALVELHEQRDDMPSVVLKPLPAPISDDDLSKRLITIISNSGEQRTGYILSLITEQSVAYENGTQTLHSIYEIGSNPNPIFSRTLSADGDSGSLVYDAQTGQALAMVIAGNSQFSYALDLINIFQLLDNQFQIVSTQSISA